LDFRSNALNTDVESIRELLKNVSPLYGMKGNTKAPSFFIRLFDEITYYGETKKYNIDLFFHTNDYNVGNMPPEYLNIKNQLKIKDITGIFQVGDTITGSISGTVADIANVYSDRDHIYLDTSTIVPTDGLFDVGDLITGSLSGATATVLEHNVDSVILTEIPVYNYNPSLPDPIERDLIVEEWQKGSRPFEYQIVSGQADFNISGLYNYINKNFHPSGYFCWIYVSIDDILCDNYLHVVSFPKINIFTSYGSIKVVDTATEGYDAGEFPPLLWAKQGIPIYIDGTVAVPYGSGGSFTDEYILYDNSSSTWVDTSDPLFIWDLINANSDFPTPFGSVGGVNDGDLYIIINSGGVTDNDASKTNTGMTFSQHKIIQWYGGSLGTWF
jgi:hypothetical protein